MKQETQTVQKGWWYVRFRIQWPENSEPSWYIDLLLAHKILSPVISEHKNNILLWRFHRRAVRDQEGHQFSLTFYSAPDTAVGIFNLLRSNPLLKKMKRAGIITQDIYDDPAAISTPKIEDTSDGNWPPSIRKSWPFFIMGICQMWLCLIAETAENISSGKKSSSFKKMLDLYQKTNDTVNVLWREQGAHAMLHHLNAIFGYEPIFVREVNLRRF